MITLTTPPAIKTVIGGSTTTSYDRFILSQITYDTVARTVNGLIRLTSTASPDMTPMTGRFRVAGTLLEVEVEQLDLYRRVTLTTQQREVVYGYITTAQSALEDGFVALGVVAGVQADGV
jgi:hypothetical protein